MDLAPLDSYRGRRVLVTGNTGFKGSWLCTWLHQLGAEVHGYALPPYAGPGYYKLCNVAELVSHTDGDVRDAAALSACLQRVKPEIVLHLAAQPLVRLSYQDPKGTFDTNVAGLVNLLDGVRQLPECKATLIVTSDKCYENREWHHGYRENDAMGGHDPYSASKGCAELVTAAYRRSFFDGRGLASARAGNVIGGGDWGDERLVPDCVRALSQGEPIVLRNPRALRPWQHVLDPLLGYLLLTARLLTEPKRYSDGFNFGPAGFEPIDVEQLANMFVQAWGEGEVQCPQVDSGAPHEAKLLRLSCDKAAAMLGWRGVLSEREAISWSVEWYRAWRQDDPQGLRQLSLQQIDAFVEQAQKA